MKKDTNVAEVSLGTGTTTTNLRMSQIVFMSAM